LHDTEPAYNTDEWDHVAEGSLHLPTGQLQVHECTGGVVADLCVEPGSYRVRSFHGGFDSIDESGLEGRSLPGGAVAGSADGVARHPATRMTVVPVAIPLRPVPHPQGHQLAAALYPRRRYNSVTYSWAVCQLSPSRAAAVASGLPGKRFPQMHDLSC
jgi:hypothetical protein